MNVKLQIIIAAVILALIGVLVWQANQAPLTETPATTSTTATTTSPSDDVAIIREAVTEFGGKMQMVSLAAPNNIARQSIKDEYGAFVTPELLAAWEENPQLAPGRLTSSPWPDHIDIASVTKNNDGGYTVAGNVVELTSKEVASTSTDDYADQYPVTITFVNKNGLWYISKYVKEPGR